MGLLDGKKIVITGVLTDASLAYGVAQLARAEGADIVLTGAGRALKLTQRTARKLGDDIDVFELDVTVPEHGVAVREALAAKWGHVDGVVHCDRIRSGGVPRRRLPRRAVGRRRGRDAHLRLLAQGARRRLPAR